MQRFILLLISCVTASCMFGMTDEKFTPARNPSGIETRITTASGELRGELIEVQDSAMILSAWLASPPKEEPKNEGRKLRIVPYAAIRRAEFDQLDSRFAIRDGQAPPGNVRERLRLVSRFPYGMSPEILAELLRVHGQTSLAGLER